MEERVRQVIDNAIKSGWEAIFQDYKLHYLLKEDSLKNAFYHHLRNQLGDGVINRNLIRIFTEYDLLDGERADIAIVKLAPKTSFKGGDYHLKERVDDVLAIIELKFKNGGNREPFRKNIEKVRRYL